MSDDVRGEIEALRARLSVLEGGQGSGTTPVATLATLNGTTQQRGWGSEDFVTNIIPPPRPNVPLYTLLGTDGLPRDERELRRCIEAVALGYSLEAPRVDIPRTWLEPLRAVYATRTGGATWTAALEAAGLEVPTDSDLTAQQQALRSELGELWDRVPAMTDWVRRNTLSSVSYRDLTLLLRQLLM